MVKSFQNIFKYGFFLKAMLQQIIFFLYQICAKSYTKKWLMRGTLCFPCFTKIIGFQIGKFNAFMRKVCQFPHLHPFCH